MPRFRMRLVVVVPPNRIICRVEHFACVDSFDMPIATGEIVVLAMARWIAKV